MTRLLRDDAMPTKHSTSKTAFYLSSINSGLGTGQTIKLGLEGLDLVIYPRKLLLEEFCITP